MRLCEVVFQWVLRRSDVGRFRISCDEKKLVDKMFFDRLNELVIQGVVA